MWNGKKVCKQQILKYVKWIIVTYIKNIHNFPVFLWKTTKSLHRHPTFGKRKQLEISKVYGKNSNHSTYLISDILLKLHSSFRLEKKGKAFPVTGRGGAQSCEKSKLPHFLHNRLTACVEVVSHTRRPLFSSQEYSWYSFLLEAESTAGT
jgi:hypothetical protein